jgi:beta-lactamase superfamily II metal-dependent hydrolase
MAGGLAGLGTAGAAAGRDPAGPVRRHLAAAAARLPGTLARSVPAAAGAALAGRTAGRGEAWVDVLDVGQGLAVVVRTREHTLLYDTGPLYSAESDAGQRIIVPYLRATGSKRIDTLVVTHRDKDHSGGVVAVEEALPIGRRLSSVPELQPERCVAGQAWEWDGVRFTMLHPAAADYERQAVRSNNMSCVLRIENAFGAVLLTSDIEARDEQACSPGRRPCCAARYCWCRTMAAAPRRPPNSLPLLAPGK